MLKFKTFFLNKFVTLDKNIFFIGFESVPLGINDDLSFFFKNLQILPVLFFSLPQSFLLLSSLLNSITLRYGLFNLWTLTLFKVFAASLTFFKNSLFCLDLIFIRKRFFPQITDINSGLTIINGSLGLMSKFFSKKKNFLRSKTSYIILSVFLRRILINIKLFNLRLKVRGLPLHLKSIINSLLTRSNSFYQNPFKPGHLVNELGLTSSFFFSFLSIHFFQNKFYGFKKTKKRGRLKRKIRKKVVLNNNIID